MVIYRRMGFVVCVLLTWCFSVKAFSHHQSDQPGDTTSKVASVESSTPAEGKKQMPVLCKVFGKTKEDREVKVWTVKNANGVTLQVLDFGGVIYSLDVPDQAGNFANISANFETVPEYQKFRPFFGSLVGRFANRIAQGKFSVDGTEYQVPVNNGKNALHGGLKGFDQVIWDVTPIIKENATGLKLTYAASDGEEGYPGNMTVTVKYLLSNDNELLMDYTATTDKPTPINLTNHTYWNLAGATSGSILDHLVVLGATHFLPTDDGLIPTGEIRPVDGTPLDFRQQKTIGKDIAGITELQFNGGYDHCLILKEKESGELSFCAHVTESTSGRTMEIWTTEPAVQFYTGNFLNGSTGVGNYKYQKQSLFCLETQHYPNSPNEPTFPNAVLRPGEVYRHTTIHKFGVVKQNGVEKE